MPVPGPNTAWSPTPTTKPPPRRCAKPWPSTGKGVRPPPASTPTVTPSCCGRCPTTTPSSASTSTPPPRWKRGTREHHHQGETTDEQPEGRDAVDDRLPDPGVEDAHHRRVLGRTRRPGPRRELVTRG